MSKQPSRAFVTAFTAAMSGSAVQAVRHEVISKRMTAAATAVIAGLVIGLTAAPAPAHAQNGNTVARSALDVIGGIVGGAIGNQVGGGNGKKAATVAGAAAGVWASEALQSGSLQPQRDRAAAPRNDSLGPVIAPGWNNTRMPSAVPAAGYSRETQSGAAQSRLPDRQASLQSGTTQMSDERMAKLVAIEGLFLKSRDGYARAIFSNEQAEDDLALDSGSRVAQQNVSAGVAQQRKAQSDYNSARGNFVSAVQHMGERGYDVHNFAYSYNLAQARVTSGDMSRGDLIRATRGARIVDQQDEASDWREHVTIK